MYAVTVQFTLRPGTSGRFMEAMHEQARQSVQLEPGCHYFDVCQHPDDPHQVFLYETYTDAAAFDAHLASDHFSSFTSFVAPLVADKQVQCWNVTENAA